MLSTENQVPAALPNQGTADTVKYLSSQLDVEGFSHGRISGPGAAAVHAANPTKPVISSECCSCQTQICMLQSASAFPFLWETPISALGFLVLGVFVVG